MQELINEPIKALVSFNGIKVKPVAFEWRGKKYQVDKVNLVYHATEEGKKIFYFSVTDQANCFNLRFNPENMQWRLNEIYNES